MVGRAADAHVAAALEREQAEFGDLLIPSTGLDLADGYKSLVPKTKAFARYAHARHPEAAFVMFADDDVLVDVPRLLEAMEQTLPRRRFYAGQVWAQHFHKPTFPQRDPSHRNYLPEWT